MTNEQAAQIIALLERIVAAVEQPIMQEYHPIKLFPSTDSRMWDMVPFPSEPIPPGTQG